MQVLLVNTSERTGGAAVACGRLLGALNNNGIKALMLVRDKQTDEIAVVGLPPGPRRRLHFVWERLTIWLANRLSKQNLFAVDIANAGTDITRLPEFRQADIIHLHWVNQGMLSLRNLRQILDSGKPVVWTMHDMWPCTGICHHARQCEGYRHACGHCPYLNGGGSKRDLSHRVFRRKQKLLKKYPLTFVACSDWLRDEAAQSALLTGHEILSIPNPINTSLFKPRDKAEARARLLLPADQKLLLFGSVKISDKRKGIDYLVESSRLLAEQHPELKQQLGVVAFGKRSEALEHLLPFRVYPQDYVSDTQRLVDLYSAVDLYVTPSLEENLPNTLMEAMACGTPCVGFRVGGIPEMIEHLETGYVARYRDAADLARGIYQTLTSDRYADLQQACVRKVAGSYAQNHVAKKYIDLYFKLLGKNA